MNQNSEDIHQAAAPITVAITDDHPMVAQGLSMILSHYSHISVSGIFRNGEELLQGLMVNVPDVLLLDIQMPGKTGADLMPEIKKSYPGLKVIVLTNFDSVSYASKMLWLGVEGYLFKTADEPTMIKAIETVAKGGRYIQDGLEEQVEAETLRSKNFSSKLAITPREKEVLQLVVDGKTDEEIGKILFLGVNTVRYYRKSILRKLDAKNTAELVAIAFRTPGLVR